MMNPNGDEEKKDDEAKKKKNDSDSDEEEDGQDKEMKPGMLSWELEERELLPHGSSICRMGVLFMEMFWAPTARAIEEEPVDRSKHWGDLEEEEEEEELEDGIQSVDSLSSTPTGVETPDVPEEKEEKIQPGTLLGTTHTHVIGSGAQDKAAAAKRVWDATAADPKLLVYLKSYRNSVPVPRHWSQKRKFLQGKCGIEKQPFQLPDFIAATGIEKIRQAYIEKEDGKKLKQKQRERMQPKMGKMDIDYQVLHDAFFKFQTKPKLTTHGDLYYEGKEFEVKLREMKPGMLSRELKEALGMPEGAPPPWLINMQRYGPPPSYPHLKIPGLNAPIPLGASFGYHPGGWGKPPVDEYIAQSDHGGPKEMTFSLSFPFGKVVSPQSLICWFHFQEEPVDRSKHWGDLEEEEEEEDEIEEEELEDGIQSVDSLSSTPTGMETPDVIDLRKKQRRSLRNLYIKCLKKKKKKFNQGPCWAPHIHMLLAAGLKTELPPLKGHLDRVDLLRGQKADKVDVTLRPEELEGVELENVLAAK
ncbi:hypothetical protein IFM89_030748 [Coptis chinensis]|uniref:PSP proline-rich domain-containing protein n=1 Tax=Coptis chinensis TaxID=261450 RepID=A0A835MB49_9MAGN|nr:hypothetical protein IFM89_030748 [Coptis chinensis]